VFVCRYIKDVYHVGYFDPDGAWEMTAIVQSQREAMDIVHYLNGGCTKVLDEISDQLHKIAQYYEKLC